MNCKILQRKFVFRFCRLVSIAIILTISPIAFANERPAFSVVEWFPAGWLEDGELKGVYADIAHLIEDQLHVEFDIHSAVVPRVLRDIERGDYDFSIFFRKIGTRPHAAYILDLTCISSVVVSKKDKPVRQMSDLNGMRVAYPARSFFAVSYAPVLDIKSFTVTDSGSMFRMALRDRIDAFVLNEIVLGAFRNGLHPDQKIPAASWGRFAEPIVMRRVPLSVSVSKKSRFQALAKRISALKSDSSFNEKLEAILRRYGAERSFDCDGLG